MELTRRGLITGLATLVAAPAVVRATSLMPVKVWVGHDPWREAVLTYDLTVRGGRLMWVAKQEVLDNPERYGPFYFNRDNTPIWKSQWTS